MKTYKGILIYNPSIIIDENNQLKVTLMFDNNKVMLGGKVANRAYTYFVKGNTVKLYCDKNGIVRKAECVM